MQPIGPLAAREIPAALKDTEAEYKRYRRLIEEQLLAVERGDLEEVARLGRERSAVSKQIEELMPTADREPLVRQDPQSRLLIVQIQRTLQEIAEADRELRARLGALRKIALEELRELESRGGQLRRYLSEYQESGGVDLRL